MAAGEPSLQREVHHLYREHHGWLFNWLRGRLGNSFDAADIAHDTFMRIWIGLRAGAIPTLREPRAYLTTVARRLVINHHERQSLERAYQASLALLPEALVPSVEERAILLETLHELDALLDELPDRVRTAFLLSQLEGLAYEDIAVQLGVSVRTVTRYMAQGFAQCLRLMLTPQP
ncbi:MULTISPECIES: sigma-70 family RNA polymerase sigma factor [unclassified Variovorax]|jgi:RNA polymerase sigma-70 factor (ECF subfamily)|uniref:sigma-70 family RNA polymerase sigma factor n=1 Tax=unclassified Variovorax TaxID=663243 RepID=UPI000F7F28D5|nr:MULTISPECIES: sigma-70 family RNA polymerase sigma factor [unclassified Variovorax]RSZ42527.1 sigma-70 family RNA polymerase sigma factor [Variovorax sp. 553]RSZ43502.1 sigma-70 family RNA polymerase sigma factor [Variovorax sp. 679]